MHARQVEPVVQTSSRSNTRRPRYARRARNAPATLASRARAPAPTCLAVRIRARAKGWWASWSLRARRAAISADWLNPRSASRLGCRGTGTTASASGSCAANPAASQSASGLAVSARPVNFSRAMASLSGASYTPPAASKTPASSLSTDRGSQRAHQERSAGTAVSHNTQQLGAQSDQKCDAHRFHIEVGTRSAAGPVA